jgi:hypothetical protein
MNRIIIITAYARGETRVSADAHLFFEKRKKKNTKGRGETRASADAHTQEAWRGEASKAQHCSSSGVKHLEPNT